MDAFDSFTCDPAYFMNTSASASESVNVDGYYCLQQVTMSDIQQQEQLGGFTNVEMDSTRSFDLLPSFSPDFSAAAYLAMCNEAQTAIPVENAFLSEIQLYGAAYTGANTSAIGAEHYSVPTSTNVPDFASPELFSTQQFNDAMYGSLLLEAAETFPPPPYTQYPTEDVNVHDQGLETSVISNYSALAANLVACFPEKQGYVTEPTIDNAVVANLASLAKNEDALTATVETHQCSQSATKAKKSNKKSSKDGKLGWVHCTPVAVPDTRDPDSPPTYRVISHPRANRKSKTATKGEKKPRVAVVVIGSDGAEKVLHFRSCVIKHSDHCKWNGCQEVVWTDRKSIREHMEMAHGVCWDPDERVTCRWENCKSNVSIDSLFRHITNTHMKVIRASCVYGCGEGYSRVDGRNRHSPRCLLKSSIA